MGRRRSSHPLREPGWGKDWFPEIPNFDEMDVQIAGDFGMRD